MRVRTRGFLAPVLFTRWRKLEESALTAPVNESNNDGGNPSVASFGIWVCNVPLGTLFNDTLGL